MAAGAKLPAERVNSPSPGLLHGRRATYQAASCRCVPCTAANAAYIAHLRQLRAHGRQPLGVHVPAAETGRRIRQILQERITRAEIARALGLKRPRLEMHTGRGEWVTLRNALKVRRLHRLWLSDDCDPPGSENSDDSQLRS